MPPPLPKPEGFVAWGGGGVSSKGTLEFRTRFGFFFFSSFEQESFKRVCGLFFLSPLGRFGRRFKRPKYFHRVPFAIVYLK